MAQFGRALRSGRRGRRFKSCHFDYLAGAPKALKIRLSVFFCVGIKSIKIHLVTNLVTNKHLLCRQQKYLCHPRYNRYGLLLPRVPPPSPQRCDLLSSIIFLHDKNECSYRSPTFITACILQQNAPLWTSDRHKLQCAPEKSMIFPTGYTVFDS